MQCKFFTILDTRTAILSKGSVSLRLCVDGSHECVHVSRRAAYSITKPEGEERVDGETVSSAQRERERGGCAKGSFVLPDETSQNDVMG